MSISIYLRQPPKAQDAPARTTNDYFLGAAKIQPNFESNKVDDQTLTIAGGTGVMHVQLCYKPQQVWKKKRGIATERETYAVLFCFLAKPADCLWFIRVAPSYWPW